MKSLLAVPKDEPLWHAGFQQWPTIEIARQVEPKDWQCLLVFPLSFGSPAGLVLLVLDFTAVDLCSLVRATNDEQSPYQFTRDTYPSYDN